MSEWSISSHSIEMIISKTYRRQNNRKYRCLSISNTNSERIGMREVASTLEYYQFRGKSKTLRLSRLTNNNGHLRDPMSLHTIANEVCCDSIRASSGSNLSGAIQGGRSAVVKQGPKSLYSLVDSKI